MDATTPGEKIRKVRKRRGLTQRELAELSGVSLSWITKLEQGVYTDTRIETTYRLAKALRVSTSTLIPQNAHDDDAAPPDVTELWEPVHRALAGRMPQPEEEPTVVGLREALKGLAPALTHHRYTAVRDILPSLLRDADALSDDPDARQIHASILNTVGYLLTQTRQFDVAEMTLNRSIDAAGDRLEAAAAADTLVWLYLRQGRLADARTFATTWADEIEPRFSRATVLELVMWGRFLLDLANSAVRDNRPGEAEDALQLAGAAAARMGREARRHENSQTVFGPVTVAYIRAETHILNGQPDRCLAIAETLPAAPPYPELVSRLRHRLDVANAFAQERRYPEAIEAVQDVRSRAPEWLAEQRYARDVIGSIVDQRRSLTPEMRELADFVRLDL